MIKVMPFKREDCFKILEWNKWEDEDFLMQWSGTTYTYPITEEQILKRLENSNPKFIINIYKIVFEKSNEIIGTIELVLNKKNNNAFIGRFLIDKNYRGKGLGQDVLRVVTKIAFDKFLVDTVKLGVYEYNKEAISCYKKVGYTISQYHECKQNSKENGYLMIIKKNRDVGEGHWLLV